MVSLRRRRNLGLNGRNPFSFDLFKPNENGKSIENQNFNQNQNLDQNQNQNQSGSSNVKKLSFYPLPPVISSNLPLVIKSESKAGPSSGPVFTVPKEEPSSQSGGQYYPGKEIKRRKRHRRKQYSDQEPCVMRGVYFKNMKWQAAIKVDKKQIHLGTVGSQEEAARLYDRVYFENVKWQGAIKVDKKQIHLGTVGSQEEAARLYDRAAFMCGREPNFELTEEAKEELRKLTWEDFLEMTRNNINNKKQQRKFGGPRRKKMEMEVQSDMGGSSQSDGTDPYALAS